MTGERSGERGFIQGDVYTKFVYTARLEGYAKYCGYNEVIRHATL